jgi:uncharacterized membrane protein YphA (DoxX/SURF4 family)
VSIVDNRGITASVELAALAARFALAAVFLLAGLAKLSSLQIFVSGIGRYELLPPRLVKPIGYAIPPLELAGGLLLALGLGTPVVAALLAAVLAVFTVAVSIALRDRKTIDCGCFGPTAPRPITWFTVGRNVLLLGLGVLVAVMAPKALALDALLRGGHHASSSTGAAMALVGTAAVFASLLASEAVRYRQLRSALEEEAA